MKKLILLLMVGLLASCGTSVIVEEELPQVEVIEPEVVVPEVVEDVIEEEPVDEVPVEEPIVEEEEVNEEFVLTLSGLLPVEACRIENVFPNQNVMAGFPISPYRLPNTGNVNVQVLFVDFPDYEGTRTEQQLEQFFKSYIAGIERFYDDQSFGRMTFSFTRHPGFVRYPRPTSELRLARSNSADLDMVLRESIRLADSLVDYTDIDMVIVFLNPDIPERVADVSPAWPMNAEGGFRTNEGMIYNATLIAGDAIRIGYPIIAHEIGHLFGLIDLYNFNWLDNNPSRDFLRQFDFLGPFDFMNLAPPGQFGDNRDMLAWQRYLLDWITDEQVRCVDPTAPMVTTHQLIPSHENRDDVKMVVVPFTNHRALVVEVKARSLYCLICSGGVYSYVVDTNFGNGGGPIRMVRPSHSTDPLFQDAFLREGQVLKYENVTIEVVAEGESTFIQVTVE